MMRPPLLFFMAALALSAAAQPSRAWDKTLGSPNWDEMHLSLLAPDGGFLLGGNVTATGGEVSQPAFGLNDYWLVKTDARGQKLWDKTYGGSENDRLWAVLPLDDGGFLLGGSSHSGVSGNKTTPCRGDADFWLIRTDALGEKIWEKTYGGSGRDELFALGRFPDGSFMLGGWSNSPVSGEKTSDSLGVYDNWVLKIAPDGTLLRQALFGGPAFENLYDAVATPDGGFLLGGASASGTTTTKTQPGRGYSDYWVLKIDEDLNREWDARFGGSDVDQLEQILPLSDGNYLLLGASMSPADGDRTAPNLGSFDFWAVKISPTGEKLRDNAYGGSQFDGATAAIETRQGTILLAGASNSPASGTKKSQNLGDYDYWLVATDSEGQQLWEKNYGGTEADAATAIVATADGSHLLVGHSESPAGGYKSENSRGFNDFWMMKTWCNVELALPPDADFCAGKTLTLAANLKHCASGDCEIEWSTGSHAPKIEILPDTLEAGFVTVHAEDRNGCSASDTMYFEVHLPPQFSLGNDTSIVAQNASVALSAFAKNATYEWSTGEISETITISETGAYAVTVTNEAGCTATDEVLVEILHSRLYIPNVFQPNENINNDVWFAQCYPGSVAEIEKVDVNDCWGHRVYSREHIRPNDKEQGWNGENRGRYCPPGAYVYRVQARFADGSTEVFFGTVTLVR